MGGRGGNRKEVEWEKRKWGGQSQQPRACVCVCVNERERDGKRENGKQHHPDREEGRTDSVLVSLTDRGGRKVGMRDRRVGRRGAQ